MFENNKHTTVKFKYELSIHHNCRKKQSDKKRTKYIYRSHLNLNYS